jgi:Flp pilus assembly pilin Flp
MMRYALWRIRYVFQSLILQEDGQDLVEYGLIVLMCVIASVASVGSLATIIVNYFQYINTHLW